MDEFELGEDVTEKFRPHRPLRVAVLSVRFTAEELEAIERIAEIDDTTLSYVVRRAVLREAYQPIVRVKRIA